MSKWMMWWHYLRSLLLAFRVLMFERSRTLFLGFWGAATLCAVVIASLFSWPSAAGTAVAAGVLYTPLARAVQRNLYRLIRPGDRVEFARPAAENDHGYRQHFDEGVVLRAMTPEEIKRTGSYDALLMEESRHFFLIRSGRAGKIIPLERIVGIEIDTGSVSA